VVPRLAAIALALSTTLASAGAQAQEDPDAPPPPAIGVPGGGPRQGPAGLPEEPGAMTYYSPALLGVGILTLVGGVVTAVSGSVLFGIAAATGVDLDPKRTSAHGPDLAALIIGGTATLASVPMIIIGAHRVPVEAPPQARRLVPSVAVGPGAVVVGFRF
jgi:hypothetical protein